MANFNDQLARMRGLMNYGRVDEKKDYKSGTMEFHRVAADGKSYGIIRESNKFYIKNAPKDKENLTEAYSYIGGWSNHKDYEYDSFNNALKNLELKLMSINEANVAKVNTQTLDPFKKEDVIIEGTEKMKNEIARFRQIMNNVSAINEETCKPVADHTEHKGEKLKDTDYDKVKGTSGEGPKKAGPFDENPSKKTSDMKQPNCETAEASGVWDAEKSQGKVQTVNDSLKEEKENDWGSEGLPSSEGVGEVGDSAPFDEKDKEVNEVDESPEGDDVEEMPVEECEAPGCETPVVEGEGEEGEADDDDLTDDDLVPDEEGENDEIVDDEDDFGSEEEPEAEEFGDEEELPADDELGEEGDDIEALKAKIDSLEAKIDQLLGGDEEEIPGDDEELPVEDEFPEEEMGDEEFPEEEPVGDEVEGEDDVELGGDDELEDECRFESKKLGDIIESIVKENIDSIIEEEGTVLHDFGKHPGYRKKPFTLPKNGEDSNEHGEDWNDDSVHGDKPFGEKIGSSAPFDKVVEKVTDSVMEAILGKKKV